VGAKELRGGRRHIATDSEVRCGRLKGGGGKSGGSRETEDKEVPATKASRRHGGGRRNMCRRAREARQFSNLPLEAVW
jgi:hypothetical protein